MSRDAAATSGRATVGTGLSFLWVAWRAMGTPSKILRGGVSRLEPRAHAKSAETNLGAASKDGCAALGGGLSFLWAAWRAMGTPSKVLREGVSRLEPRA